MNNPTEYESQCALVEYLEILKAQGKVVLFTALPNNVWTRSWSQKIKQKKEGLRKGFPDLCIVFKNFKKLVFIEMKREKGGKLSEEQALWIYGILDTGNLAYVCKGFNEAKEIIDIILKSLELKKKL